MFQDFDGNGYATCSPDESPFTSRPNNVHNDCDDLREFLPQWALESNITHDALSKLLKKLKTYESFRNMPVDARTILSTPRSTPVTSLPSGGVYCYIGLEKSIIDILTKKPYLIPNLLESGIKIDINIDGVGVTHSSPASFWTILGRIKSDDSVFLVSAFHDLHKPVKCNEFLKEFVDEIVHLNENGMNHGHLHLSVTVNWFIMDMPAKSAMLGIVGHSGYDSCTKCTIHGEYCKKRTCFPIDDNPLSSLRTNETFRGHVHATHHKKEDTILERIDYLDMITHIVLDPMHLVFLGCVRAILSNIENGKVLPAYDLTKANRLNISHYIENCIKPHCPREFSRKPRSLKYVKNWKATESRQFLLYYMVGLKKVLQKDVYLHLLHLHVAVYILSSHLFENKKMVNYAESLLIYFVRDFPEIYGRHAVGPNVHGLLHLANEVRNLNSPLGAFGAWPFESFMQVVKKCVRKGELPLQQLHRRYTEIVKNRKVFHKEPLRSERFSISNFTSHKNGPLFARCKDPQFYAAKNDVHYINCKHIKDSCFGTVKNEIIIVKNIAFHEELNDFVIIGQKFTKKSNAYVIPCESRYLGIYNVEKLSTLRIWSLSDIKRKYYVIPNEASKYVVVPLLH